MCYNVIVFIRETRTKNLKSGTVYKKHQLVEAIRTESGPRQRIVMELGTLDIDKQEFKKLASLLSSRLSGKDSLFDDDSRLSKVADSLVSQFNFKEDAEKEKTKRRQSSNFQKVDLASATTSFNRSLGPELVAVEFFKRVGLDDILKSLKLTLKQESLIKAQVIARLISPGSELSTHRFITKKSSLPEFLDVDLSSVNKNQIYEIADLLVLKKVEIETRLVKTETKLFNSTRKLLLYDLTNTYLEGQAKNNSLAAYGHSKEKRSDCLLVTLALVVDEYGLPVYSEILKGNQSEPETLADVLNRLEDSDYLFNQLKPTVVMDRGIATKDNLDLLISRDYQYIVIERVNDTLNYIDEFINAKDTFQEIGNSASDKTASDSSASDKTGDKQVFVKDIEVETGTKVLCLSVDRALKDAAIDTARHKRFTEAFNKLKTRIENGHLTDEKKVNIQLGKLSSKHASAMIHYEIVSSYETNKSKRKVKSLALIEKDSLKQKTSLYGCYVITTNRKDIEASEIWNLYMTLTKVENAFRSLKSSLGLRPVHHQKETRTVGHLFISVLAYHLLASIEYSLKQSGDNRGWSTIKEVLSTHLRSTLIFSDNKDQIHHLRVSSTPEPEQKAIYDALQIKDKLPRKHKIIGSL